VAERLGKLDDTIMVAAARPFTLIGAALFSRPVSSGVREEVFPTKPRSSPPAKDSPPPRERRSAVPPEPGRVFAVAEDKEVADREEAKFKKQFGEMLKDEGLLILRVTRKPDRAMAEMTLTDLKPTVARLTDFGLKTRLQAEPGRGKVRESSSGSPQGSPPRPKDSPPPGGGPPPPDR